MTSLFRRGRGRLGDRGFTLIELLIVLALIGILLAVVVPNLGGFIQRGSERAYDTDRQIIQAAVDAYYTDVRSRPTRRFPSFNGLGSNAAAATSFIYMDDLLSGAYLRDVPASASSSNTRAATSTGTYTWYVLLGGVVSSTPIFDGRYP